jgi:hypothetical protein
MRTLVLLILGTTLLACGDKDDTGSATESDADADADTDADTDADADTDTDTDTTAPVRALGWSLHPDHGSLVYATWEQDFDGVATIRFSMDGGETWQETPERAAVAGKNQHLIVGIPYGHTAQWVLTATDTDASVEYTVIGDDIVTGDWPEDFPVPTILASEPTGWLPTGNYLLSSINEDDGGWTQGTYWTFIMDRHGRLVWANETPQSNWTLFAQVAVSGDHILWDEATKWSLFDQGEASTVHRVYLDAEIEEVSTPGLHHAFVQLPDGTLAWGSKYHGGGEALVEMSLEDREVDVLWTCNEDWPGSGSCESNGLFYVEATDSFLYSFYTNDSVVEVDRATGESLWWAGRVEGGYSFDPTEHQFDWQHGISYTDTGSLLLSTLSTESGSITTMLREYTVDHKAGTLTSIWAYDAGVHAGTNGDAWRLSNGNTLHTIGSAGHVLEVTPDGEEVWHITFNDNFLMGRSELIEDLYTLVSPE